MVERTVLPPEHPDGLTGVLALLTPESAGRATLTGPDGTRLELPGEVVEVLREVVAALSQGFAITVAPHQTVRSTSEAAQLLGVSRPTLARLLESGEIPFDKPGAPPPGPARRPAGLPAAVPSPACGFAGSDGGRR